MLLRRCVPVTGKTQRIRREIVPKGTTTQWAVMQTPNALGRFVFFGAFSPPVCCPVSRADRYNGNNTARCFPLVTLLQWRERQSDMRALCSECALFD